MNENGINLPKNSEEMRLTSTAYRLHGGREKWALASPGKLAERKGPLPLSVQRKVTVMRKLLTT